MTRIRERPSTPGARTTYLHELPEASGRDLRRWADGFLVDKGPSHRRLPGAAALAGALQRLDVG